MTREKMVLGVCWCVSILLLLGILTPIEVVMMMVIPSLPKNIMGFILDVNLAAMFVISLTTIIYEVKVLKEAEKTRKDPLDVVKEDVNNAM